MKKLSLTVVLVMAVMMLPLRAGEAEVVQKRFDTDPGKQTMIHYTGKDGDVFVQTHDKNEILFKFKKELKGSKSARNMEYFKKIQPEMDFADNRLTIEIKYHKRGFDIFRSLSGFRLKVVSTLLVPVNSDIKIKVVDGDIDAEGVKGKVGLRSVDGDLKVEDCEGAIMLKTVDGDVEVKRSAGTVKVQTTDGDVEGSGVFSGIDFKSVDGEGKFTFLKGSVLTEDCNLRTVDGDIRLVFNEKLAFKLDAKTHDGDIKIDGLQFKNLIL
jgi:DUF4097 and DUF4098 domain-containing protein YvlB